MTPSKKRGLLTCLELPSPKSHATRRRLTHLQKRHHFGRQRGKDLAPLHRHGAPARLAPLAPPAVARKAWWRGCWWWGVRVLNASVPCTAHGDSPLPQQHSIHTEASQAAPIKCAPPFRRSRQAHAAEVKARPALSAITRSRCCPSRGSRTIAALGAMARAVRMCSRRRRLLQRPTLAAAIQSLL